MRIPRFIGEILKIAPSGVYPNQSNFGSHANHSAFFFAPSMLQRWGWLRRKCCYHNHPFAFTRAYRPSHQTWTCFQSCSTIVVELVPVVQFSINYVCVSTICIIFPLKIIPQLIVMTSLKSWAASRNYKMGSAG